MKRKRIDSKVERRLLVAMIVSKEFLGQAVAAIDLEVIDSRLFQLIAKWCLDYFDEYKDAPKANIESIYYEWVEGVQDDSIADDVHDFLESLSEGYEEEKDLNVPYLLDLLNDFLARKNLVMLQDTLEAHLSRGDARKATEAVTSYRSIEVGKGQGIDPLNDRDVWTRAFSEPMQPLIEFPGAAGKFFNNVLVRDSLIGIQAPEKTGKTFWCLEFLVRALQNRKKVALFEVGDLSESQIMLRLGTRLAKRPLNPYQCGKIARPVKIVRDNDEETGYYIENTTEVVKQPLTKKAVIRARRKFLRRCGIPKGRPYVQVSIHPNSSINVRGIESILDRWEYEKQFVPDVIIIDYADILAPEDNKKQGRDQINDTWKALRRLTQERHVLGIVPTQADAASYGSKLQSMRNFSEDKRKLSHVNGMFALNQTNEEKDIGGMRLNWIVLREASFSTHRCLYVGTCFALARAFCCSAFIHRKESDVQD